MYDFCVVGNGSVGLMTAYELVKNFPDKKVALIGPKSQFGSASIAAGAMHAVFAEIESHFESNKGDQKKFELAQKSKKYWDNFFDTFGKEALTAKDTLLYLKNLDNPFEIANYKVATKIASEHQVLRNASNKEIKDYTNLSKYEEVVVIEGEFAFCPLTVCRQLYNYLEKQQNFTIIDDFVTEIGSDFVLLERNVKIFTHTTIVANGAAAYDLLKDYGCMPVYQGVGTAIIVDSKTIDYGNDYVVRTVNRGGAQCGLHVVPRADGTHYIGAGNYLAEYDDRSDHRLETVRYLTAIAEDDILGEKNVYNMRGSLTHGKRPRSFDGWPLFGRLRDNNNIIVATGWNRVGLSLSPLIASEIISTIKDENDLCLTGWDPDRQPISFGDEDVCAKFFAESRCANLIEHKILEPNSQEYQTKYEELFQLSKVYNNRITKELDLDSGLGIHPDLYGILIS